MRRLIIFIVKKEIACDAGVLRPITRAGQNAWAVGAQQRGPQVEWLGFVEGPVKLLRVVHIGVGAARRPISTVAAEPKGLRSHPMG